MPIPKNQYCFIPILKSAYIDTLPILISAISKLCCFFSSDHWILNRCLLGGWVSFVQGFQVMIEIRVVLFIMFQWSKPFAFSRFQHVTVMYVKKPISEFGKASCITFSISSVSECWCFPHEKTFEVFWDWDKLRLLKKKVYKM